MMAPADDVARFNTPHGMARPIDVATTVVSTPELKEVLDVLPNILFIESGDTLQDVRIVTDVATSQAENWDFFKNVLVGDYILQFRDRSVLYRPSQEQIINMGVLSVHQ